MAEWIASSSGSYAIMAEAVSTKPIVEKLNIKPESRVYLHAGFEPVFLSQIVSQLAAHNQSDVLLLLADQIEDLKAVPGLAKRMLPAAGLWIVYPKGKKHITQNDVLLAGRAVGLTDNKVVSFSETHTGLRFVIPVSNRPSGKRPVRLAKASAKPGEKPRG